MIKGGMGNLMKQAQKMQEQMTKAQEELLANSLSNQWRATAKLAVCFIYKKVPEPF